MRLKGAEYVQLAKIRFRLAGQITWRSDLLHFSTGINTLACSHTSMRAYASHVQAYTHTHTVSPTLISTPAQYVPYQS